MPYKNGSVGSFSQALLDSEAVRTLLIWPSEPSCVRVGPFGIVY